MMELNKIYCGKCEEVMKNFPDNYFDSCVTDPPYGISFMNKHWDYQLPQVETWKEILRVLKPGAHILVACGTRTQHRMAVNIEDAGFEIRDVITWHYGSGFPKSLDISKAIDKMNGAEREVIGEKEYSSPDIRGNSSNGRGISGIVNEGKERLNISITAPATDAAKQWEGWGTGLKPATEFWTLARKPISENTIAENVLKHGTGGINIDGSRISTNDSLNGGGSVTPMQDGWDRPFRNDENKKEYYKKLDEEKLLKAESLGRFPANVIFDEFTGKILDEQSGKTISNGSGYDYEKINQDNTTHIITNIKSGFHFEDAGGASRFFYCPKADGYERNKGLNGFEKKESGFVSNTSGQHLTRRDGGAPGPKANNHPTVKPIDLMRYLVKLITPKKGITLDPFAGSGTTLIGAKLELINYIGIEMNEDYCKIAEARVSAWNPPKYIEQKLF